jgi:hypothetical protein
VGAQPAIGGRARTKRASARWLLGSCLIPTTCLLLTGCATPETAGGWQFEPGPHPPAYRPYAADPRASRIGLTATTVLDKQIQETSGSRLRLQAGGNVGLARWEGEDSTVQLEGEAGFAGEFDLSRSNDNIGWDGIYSLLLSWRLSPELAWRFGMHHVSSHIGDEYAALVDRERINATREEVLLGISRMLTPHWRVYGEGGWAYHLGNYSLLDRFRFQAGAEYESPSKGGDAPGWYAACDLSSYEEDDWEPNLSLQWGFLFEGKSGLRPMRVGLEVYAGRSRMGEFFDERETMVAIGLWL